MQGADLQSMSFLDAARDHIRFVYTWHAQGTLAFHSLSLPVSSAALSLPNRPSPKSPPFCGHL
eukprot:10770992-Heterocapsa_arctica.AAC.1